jgi:hypothetical protein
MGFCACYLYSEMVLPKDEEKRGKIGAEEGKNEEVEMEKR